MKKFFLVIGLAAIIGCGKSGPASEGARERTRSGSLENGPLSKDKPGVEFPGEYPSGTNLQQNQNSNAGGANPKTQPPFGTGRASSGSYERTNNQER